MVFVKEYLKRLFKEGSRLRFNTFGEDIIKLSIKGKTTKNELELLKSIEKEIRKDFMMGGLAIDIGEIAHISQLINNENQDLCETHIQIKESLNKIDAYSEIFDSITPKDIHSSNPDLFLRLEKLPLFNEV